MTVAVTSPALAECRTPKVHRRDPDEFIRAGMRAVPSVPLDGIVVCDGASCEELL